MKSQQPREANSLSCAYFINYMTVFEDMIEFQAVSFVLKRNHAAS